MEHDFQGKEGQDMPVMPDDFVEIVSERYIQLYELLTGRTFEKIPQENILSDIRDSVLTYLSKG